MNQKLLKDKLSYSPSTGLFEWIVDSGNAPCIGDIAGYVNNLGYVCIKINSKLYFAHRLAWLYMTGDWPVDQIDHINHIRDDNRWANLRDVTVRQNHHNTLYNNKHVGVSFNKGKEKWQASIYINRKSIYLGTYKTHLAAAYARHNAENYYGSR